MILRYCGGIELWATRRIGQGSIELNCGLVANHLVFCRHTTFDTKLH